jgi:hypothetical protein
MFTRKATPNKTDLFQVPFSGVMSWNNYIDLYPDITNEMDGSCRENCLSFYYEKNLVNGIYIFRDEDAEFDIANILGIDLNITVEGESIEDKITRKIQSDDIYSNDIFEFESSLEVDILDSNYYKKKKEETKRLKKERRQQRVQERLA